MTESVNAMVAGSESFVDALGASLRLRLGAAPVVARDPAAALRACRRAELIVVECGGPEWLGAVRDLRTRRDRASCSIVAAFSGAQVAEAEALRQAGADEAVAWDGRIDPVVWAVDRAVAARARAAAPVAGSAPLASSAPDASAASPARPPAVPGTRSNATPSPDSTPAARVAARVPAARVAARGPVARVPAARVAAARVDDGVPLMQPIAHASEAPPPPVPAELPSHEDVEALLAAWLRSGRCAPELEAVTCQVGGSLSDVEKAALSGEPLAVEPAPLRRGAALRWRVLAVLAQMKAGGGALDPAASPALTAELDAALGALTAAADAAPAELLAPLAAARNALVSVAIELTEAMARAHDVESQGKATLPRLNGPATRVLRDEAASHEPRSARRLVVLGCLAALAAGVAVTHRLSVDRAALIARARHRLPGAPANTIGVARGAGKFLSALPGRVVDPVELERFRLGEEAKGNVVEQVGPGTWVVRPKGNGGGSP